MNRDYQNYNLYDLASNVGDFKMLLDTVNNKYNQAIWKQFTTVLPASNSHRFSAIVEETNVIVKASPLGAMGKKPLRSFEGGEAYGDSIHKIGHGFKVDQSDLNHIKELNLVNYDLGYEMVKKYMGRAEAIVGGFHTAWNSWVFEALSNQQITLKPQGHATGYDVDLRVPAANKLVAAKAAWFAQSGEYDIIDDLKRMNALADDDSVNMPANRVFLCSKTLYDKIIADAGVQAAIKGFMILTSDDLKLSDSYIKQQLSVAFGIPPIVAINEKSRIEIDGVPTVDNAAFDVNKIVLVPVSQLFNMHNSPSDYSQDSNPNTIKSDFEGGLIGAIQLYESDPFSVVTNMESWSFISYKNPKWVVSLDTSSFS